MITGHEVGQVLGTLPEHSFIRNYCWWAAHCTDAPLAYHVGTALSLLGVIAPIEFQVQLGITVHAPQWAMLVGASADSRKTSAITLGAKILAQAYAHKLGATPGSVQGLHTSLQETPQQLIAYGEFGSFLSSSVKGGVLAALREEFTSVWDCRPVNARLAKFSRVIDNPRLSLLVGVTPTYLETLTTHNDWEGGFLSRFLVLHAKREHTYVLPPGLPHMIDPLVAGLLARGEGCAGGSAGVTEDAREFYTDWFMDNAQRAQEHAKEWAQGLTHRAPTVALKAALMHALDTRHEELGDFWELSVQDLEFGVAIANWHLNSAFSVLNYVASSKVGQQSRSVLKAIGDRVLTLGEIIERATPEMSRWEVQKVLESLCERKRVYTTTLVQGTVYSTQPLDQVSTFVNYDEDEGRNRVLPFKKF